MTRYLARFALVALVVGILIGLELTPTYPDHSLLWVHGGERTPLLWVLGLVAAASVVVVFVAWVLMAAIPWLWEKAK